MGVEMKARPESPSESGTQVAVACAFCESTDTEFLSLFGQNLISSQYYCRNCHTVFEAVRWTESEPREGAGE